MKRTLSAFLPSLLFTTAAFAADPTGKWLAQVPGRTGNRQSVTINLKASGGMLTGTVSTPQGDLPIANGKFSGDDLSFTQSLQGRDGTPQTVTWSGKIIGDSIAFTRDNGRRPVSFTAKKQ